MQLIAKAAEMPVKKEKKCENLLSMKPWFFFLLLEEVNRLTTRRSINCKKSSSSLFFVPKLLY